MYLQPGTKNMWSPSMLDFADWLSAIRAVEPPVREAALDPLHSASAAAAIASHSARYSISLLFTGTTKNTHTHY